MKDKIIEILKDKCCVVSDEHGESNVIYDNDIDDIADEMLKLLLPWRDFDKEKPEEGGRHIITYEVEKGCDFNFMEFNNLDNDFNNFKYWMYKEDLLATLPKEKR